MDTSFGELKIERVSGTGHLEALERLAREIWTEHYTPIVGAGQVEYMLREFQTAAAISEKIREGDLYFLVRTAGREIGYLAVRPDPARGEMYLSKIYLRAEERGKGYGWQMVDFVETLARERALPRVRLNVHKRNPTIGVYQRMGFRIVGPVTQDIGGGFMLDDYQMEKSLS
jgi:ribosomal protein S18 acetylase RimI-like enzyme